MSNSTSSNIRSTADNIADRVSGNLGDTAKAAGSSMRDASRKIASTAGDISDRASNVAQELSDRVEQQPLTSVLVAAGAGLMLGLLIGRR